MLSKEQNELLTRVGKGTPMGETMRRYWHPIATSDELPHPDCDPLRAKLLGETFVVFRDTEGKVGVMDELCLHRGASMALGRVEDGGIRCLYHGWKFDVTGKLMETPNHADPRVRERLRAKAYPVREQSGLIWTYIGPKEHEPPFRHFAYDKVPESNRVLFKLVVKANYLQMWEGGTDSSHVGILHSNVTRPGWLADSGAAPEINDMVSAAWDDTSPQLEIENTGFGFHYVGMRAAANPEQRNIRLVPLFMPTGRIIEFPDFYTTVFDTPLDDETTASYLVDASDVRQLDLNERLKRSGLVEERFYKNTEFVANWDTRFNQDRESMREKRSWSGFHGITQEDAVISTSMGPIYDRSTEHLVAADAAIVRLRQRLFDSVQRFQDGLPPIGVELGDLTHMRGFDLDIGKQETWRPHAAHHVEHYPAKD
ncbi:Rieske 2Fe-2S domain-containing protein [Variovorax sp. KK3]|uniref:Rieske 2Fe-2S domain-containing protein n=1 Tax=Variovorax sp. KK3 TaxID=1855728 RepID=UPI00097C60EA|nr:Rieske 2Fe-2S domain-containing protein [Variovorax sp. KK3]